MEFGNIPKDALIQTIEKIERLEEEKNSLQEDIKEVYKNAKMHGFDIGIIKKIIVRRKKDIAKLREEEELLDLYMHALGMISQNEDI